MLHIYTYIYIYIYIYDISNLRVNDLSKLHSVALAVLLTRVAHANCAVEATPTGITHITHQRCIPIKNIKGRFVFVVVKCPAGVRETSS